MPRASEIEFSSYGMNTDITCKAYGNKTKRARACVVKEIRRLENKLSRFIPSSEIGRLNRSAGKAPVKVSPETFAILGLAIHYSEISHGLFDISIGPLMDVWDIAHASYAPSRDGISQASCLVGYHDLTLNWQERTAMLRKPGQSIDLGGIGKGYASDRCIEVLQGIGITSAAVNIGGNVSVLGAKPDGRPWQVGIRHPRKCGRLLGALDATVGAIVTSGDYERFFMDAEGRRYHHILNPITGHPVDSGLISVTVVACDGLTADALSTAIFVAGIEEGLEYLGRSTGAEAVLMDENQQVFITKGLEARFRGFNGIDANLI